MTSRSPYSTKAIFAIGVAAWFAHKDGHSPAARGLVIALLVYNIGVVTILAYAAIAAGGPGQILWPIAPIHAALAAWCVMQVRDTSSQVVSQKK